VTFIKQVDGTVHVLVDILISAYSQCVPTRYFSVENLLHLGGKGNLVVGEVGYKLLQLCVHNIVELVNVMELQFVSAHSERVVASDKMKSG
jgi:hypothetical protein